ncbi:annexin A7 [Amyelois transitella]|uniref:annexin A7 n=1 Tax=Amyelois transitella TaxID=680683 RepID=UPI00067C8282|nr:annexin A7 [Amyelois transitella]
MSGYPFNNQPGYYPPPGQMYPGLPPQGAPVPGAPYPIGFSPYGMQPGQVPGQPMGQPPISAMSYPGLAGAAPSAPPPAYAYPAYPGVPQQPTFAPTVEWVPSTNTTAQSLADRAVVAGYEGHDGSPLWVIRARFEGDLIPGKLAIKHKSAYVAWGGKENPVQNIEVCCARPETVKWVESRDGHVPPNAVAAGTTDEGEPLYVGRAKQQGSLTPGKIHQSHKVLYISFAGQEIPHSVYEVLCTA